MGHHRAVSNAMKSSLDGIMTSVVDMRKKLSDCTEQVAQTDLQSEAENGMQIAGQGTCAVEEKNKLRKIKALINNLIMNEQPEAVKSAPVCKRTRSLVFL